MEEKDCSVMQTKEINKSLKLVFGTPQGRAIVFYRPAGVVAGGLAFVASITAVFEVGARLVS